MRGSPPPHPTELSCSSTKQSPLSTAIVSNSELPTSSPETSVLAKTKSGNDDTSPTNSLVGSAKPKGPRRIVTLSDSEPTERHETRGHSSWFGVVLSRIRLHSLRMSLVSACKHHGVLRWSGGRRRAAPSNLGHEGVHGALRIDRDTHPRSLCSKL